MNLIGLIVDRSSKALLRTTTSYGRPTVQNLELALAKQATTIITWTTGILVAQGALIVALIEYFK